MLAPICLFTYNRLTETRQTVQALQQNFLAPESELVIFSDGPKNKEAVGKVQAVRDYLQSVTGFKSVVVKESQKNKGLANSIISGVTEVIEKHGKVIVLEDDLITAPNFLDFMNQALEHYASYEEVKSINGFSPAIQKNNTSDVYFQTRTFPWGWATWGNRWDTMIFSKERIKNDIESNKGILEMFKKECGADISKMLLDSVNGINDSWYVRWVYDHFRKNLLALYPRYTLVENSGFNEAGTHCKTINPYRSILDANFRRAGNFNFDGPIEIDPIVKNQFLRYFSKKYRLGIRLKLLFKKGGWGMLWEDVKSKLF